MDLQDHAQGMVAHYSIGVRSCIVEQLDDGGGGVFSRHSLLGRDAVDRSEHRGVYRLGIKQQGSKDLLDSAFVTGFPSFVMSISC
eukprot:10770907-Ditylum_brightwellii.AAC.2